MKLIFSFIFLILLTNQVFAQSFKEVTLKTEIKEVTVFLQGALITRKGKTAIQKGKSKLIIKSLSPHIDEKSIQVKANGNFTVLSVKHKFNYLNELQKDKSVDSLYDLVDILDVKISKKNSRLEILTEMKSVLTKNKDLGGKNAAVSLTQLKQALDLYDQELSDIKNEELTTNISLKELKKEKTELNKQIAAIANNKDLPSSEIEVRIEADTKTNGDFTVSYLVANAGWYPNYDVRVKNIDNPIELTYKADVYQNTGIDWENVKLRFSNGDPNQSSVAPELKTWFLNYTRNTNHQRKNYNIASNLIYKVSGVVLDEFGEPLPGATVQIRGSTIGTITDLDGNYSLTLPNGSEYLVFSFVGMDTKELPINSSVMNVTLNNDAMALSEVVVAGVGRGYGRRSRQKSKKKSYEDKSLDAKTITTTVVENQTNVEFEVEKPYSIKSNGEKMGVDLNKFEIETVYEYYAVPKLDKDAFLMARVMDWDKYNLLEGEANLYFEDAYVGRSILDARSLTDTLNISLGRDKNIVIGRTKMNDFSKRRTIGANKVDSRGFDIIVKNKKSQAINVKLFDQIPISSLSSIEVTPTELSKGILNEKTGEIIWELKIPANTQKDLKLSYKVKYPKRESLSLE